MPSSSPSCTEAFGSKVEGSIGGIFHSIGQKVGTHPRKTILGCILLTVLTGYGFASWEVENRGEKLWVPQNTIAEQETEDYQDYYPTSSRFNSLLVQSGGKSTSKNVLQKEKLEQAMKLHLEIETRKATVEREDYDFLSLCTVASGSCVSKFDGVCACLVDSILKLWNYDLDTLQNDSDIMATINQYGTMDDLQAVLGNPIFDEDTGELVSAEAFSISYFLESQSEVVNGNSVDPINEGWEADVFLDSAELSGESDDYDLLEVDYISSRSFDDEFGGAIEGDLFLVQISYIVAFLFLAANMGNIRCGTGSRWTMALSALLVVGLSTAAGFGLSSIFGLFFGPVHSILPFILLGIGVDDAFVIVNAFNRERKVARTSETNEDLAKRCSRGLARAGASITVTSLTDMAAFGISSSSSLPALSSFCAYAAVSIFFLWLYASTFFSATLVLDERRQRDNRRECLCCLTRKNPIEEEEGEAAGFKEDNVSRYFRNYHAPAILSKAGKIVILTVFAGLFGFGLWGAMNLTVEDSERSFVPEESYLNDYLSAADEYYPSTGIDLFIVIENDNDGSKTIYEKRQLLADLHDRLSGLSNDSPYIAEPVSDSAYRNVMSGLSLFLTTAGSEAIGNVTLGDGTLDI